MLIVTMTAECYRSQAHRVFEMGSGTWDLVQQIGLRFGWQPKGTIADIETGKYWSSEKPSRDCRKRQDYKCDDIEWSKIVGAFDAYLWSIALDGYLEANRAGRVELASAASGPTVLFDGMTKEQNQALNNPEVRATVEAFSAFLKKGQFRFSWDD